MSSESRNARQQKVQRELSDRILNLTGNGEEMIQFYYEIMNNSEIALTHRMKAADWLSDRSWGKEPAVLHVDAGGIFQDLLEATDAELVKIAAQATIPENFELDGEKVLNLPDVQDVEEDGYVEVDDFDE